jgi:hypothetical protein
MFGVHYLPAACAPSASRGHDEDRHLLSLAAKVTCPGRRSSWPALCEQFAALSAHVIRDQQPLAAPRLDVEGGGPDQRSAVASAGCGESESEVTWGT